MYDHVWAQTDVCLDANAVVVYPCPSDSFWTTGILYQHFIADDYTWASAEAGLIQENSGCSARGAGAPISNRLGCATDGSLNQSRLEASAPFS